MPKRKDNVDLVCDIAELASLFERSSRLDDFLSEAVSMIAWHMKAAVCSIYLYDHNRGELILRANQGLSPDSIGHIKLDLGEGLTGQALNELRPILEPRGSQNPHYKPLSDIGEEKYEAFLAVPIVRGLNRVGAIVLQDPQPNYFTERDVKALKAIAAQLANTIQNAELFLNMKQTVEEPDGPEREPARVVKGQKISDGLTFGTAIFIRPREELIDRFKTDGHTGTLDDFEKAMGQTETQLNQMQRDLERSNADIASMIFSAHLLMLQDSAFSGKIKGLIEEGDNATAAITKVVQEYIELFSNSENALLREKVYDIMDLGHRLLQNLLPMEIKHPDYNGNIVVTQELMPSDIVKLTAQRVEGVILVGGSATSHVSILLKSFQLPVVLVEDKSVLDIEDETPILLDATHENVYLHPNEDLVKGFRDSVDSERAVRADENEWLGKTLTKDKFHVSILANVNLIRDVDTVLKVNAEGIGLYRSEFPFIIRNDFPSEEEQYGVYLSILQKMEGRDVVFRTLDLGGDKIMTYYPSVNEANPFLGLRAIRFSLQNKNIFSQQLRALLRAGCGEDLRIMFPMVSSVDDFTEARDVVFDCIEELKREGVAHNDSPRLGVMVEIPSAVELIDEIADASDFMCIGTNDLIQYLLAVDRTNEHISHLYMNHHPAVLRALNRIAIRALSKPNSDLSICGELVQDENMIPFLLGIGIRKFSVDPRAIPKVRKAVATVTFAEAEKIAQDLLSMGRVDEIEAYLESRVTT